MSFESQTYHSPIYRNFRNIEAGEYRHIIRYYERYEKEILQLDFEEYVELLVTYTHALFEIGDYRKHLLMADVVIRTSILQNVTKVRGKEIYHATLFKKAASHYNLHEYSEAKHILEELIKMNPYNTLTVQFLGRVMRDNKPRYLRNTHAASVLFFLLSAFTICIEVLLLKYFAMSCSFWVSPCWAVQNFGIGGKYITMFKISRKM